MSRVELHTVVARMETRVDHSTNVYFVLDGLSIPTSSLICY